MTLPWRRHNQNIKDYGLEVGGPLVQGRLWFWGSYSKQDIKAGILGFQQEVMRNMGLEVN